MPTLIAGLFKHTVLLLTFMHAGTQLPKENSGLVKILAVLFSLLFIFKYSVLAPETLTGISLLLNLGIFLGILFLLATPAFATAALLTSSGLILIYAAAKPWMESFPWLSSILFWWELVAWFVIYTRIHKGSLKR